MKLLIAYDGSAYSESAIDDLSKAGLPAYGEATVISVAEVWLPPDSSDEIPDENIHLSVETQASLQKHLDQGKRRVAEAQELAEKAADRIRNLCPGWKVDAVGTYGSPAWAVLDKADDMSPDLIVSGSQGRSALGRLVLGSISQKVLTEARCSVRVARGSVQVDPGPVRIIIGFDGSAGSDAAVAAVADRKWPENSEVRIIAVTEALAPSTFGGLIPSVSQAVGDINDAEAERMEGLVSAAAEKLSSSGINANYRIVTGSPKKVLLDEAESWSADCVFVGANRFGSRMERFLLGSTSAAIAARAQCSVEVVRNSGEA